MEHGLTGCQMFRDESIHLFVEVAMAQSIEVHIYHPGKRRLAYRLWAHARHLEYGLQNRPTWSLQLKGAEIQVTLPETNIAPENG